jgi:hypothetical protein
VEALVIPDALGVDVPWEKLDCLPSIGVDPCPHDVRRAREPDGVQMSEQGMDGWGPGRGGRRVKSPARSTRLPSER